MVYAYLLPSPQVVGIVIFPFTPALTGAIGWTDNTHEEILLRMVGHQRVEELLRLQTGAALLQVCSEVRQELLPFFYESFQFHIDGIVTLGILASRLGRDTPPHVRSLTLSPTFFDTDDERSIIISLAMSRLRWLRSLTIKGSKAEGLLMEYKGKGIYGYPKIAGRHVRQKSLIPETVELGYGRRLSREMVETLKCIRQVCPALTAAFYDSSGPFEVYNDIRRPTNPYPDVLLVMHESASDGWTAFDIDKVVDRDWPGTYQWQEDRVRKRLTPFEGETYNETEGLSDEQGQELTFREYLFFQQLRS